MLISSTVIYIFGFISIERKGKKHWCQCLYTVILVRAKFLNHMGVPEHQSTLFIPFNFLTLNFLFQSLLLSETGQIQAVQQPSPNQAVRVHIKQLHHQHTDIFKSSNISQPLQKRKFHSVILHRQNGKANLDHSKT